MVSTVEALKPSGIKLTQTKQKSVDAMIEGINECIQNTSDWRGSPYLSIHIDDLEDFTSEEYYPWMGVPIVDAFKKSGWKYVDVYSEERSHYFYFELYLSMTSSKEDFDEQRRVELRKNEDFKVKFVIRLLIAVCIVVITVILFKLFF